MFLSLFLMTSLRHSSENKFPCSVATRREKTDREERAAVLVMLETRWVRICVVVRGGLWSNEPVPMFGTNDQPEGIVAICSPDVCKFVAWVRWREYGPLWLSASTKSLKWCTKEALHCREHFPKNPISFLTDFLPSRQRFSLFQCAIKISPQTQSLIFITSSASQWTAWLLYVYFQHSSRWCI